MKFREYQLKNIEIGLKQCLTKRWCYLSMQVRTGKSLTALGIAARLGGNPKRVVFVTKKKAIPSIESDVKMLNDPTIKVETINYESLHKLDLTTHIDVWILDESHKLGAFPKPSEKTKWDKQHREQSKKDQLWNRPTGYVSYLFHLMCTTSSMKRKKWP